MPKLNFVTSSDCKGIDISIDNKQFQEAFLLANRQRRRPAEFVFSALGINNPMISLVTSEGDVNPSTFNSIFLPTLANPQLICFQSSIDIYPNTYIFPCLPIPNELKDDLLAFKPNTEAPIHILPLKHAQEEIQKILFKRSPLYRVGYLLKSNCEG